MSNAKRVFLVKQRDWTMKELLLEMTEWHALTKNNGSIDTWHMGKNIHSWTDSTTLKQIHKAFGHFDEQDAYQAYNVTTQLYSRLAKDVAKMNKWTYPTQVEELILMLDPVKQNV
ncbi:aminoglycoside 6-adenylyltransferase [Commensalibacter oyaizuii]|uniref:Aminoglycoside 6-adenylyltransferase n=1 Tax=Commensalibacter oyaizuii TaxID=3043873 RepID=A0ABT6Q3M1_9PROT|nr:aminoglycoside 6-adenylyltransferase [Commensalibacter sp. TBRC 16381]MDI2091710.1 aminoglycoside 6-adenylyltransferase [Commensalibacter sp. TBRC 16381]